MKRAIMVFLIVTLASLAPPCLALAKTVSSLKLGILAYRPDSIVVNRYQPLADYLSGRIGIPIQLEVLTQEEMNSALAANQLDFFMTNPSHFLVIRSERSLTGVLATLVRKEGETATSSLGGVIFTEAGRNDIQTLADVAGKTVATPGMDYLGGFLAPLFELENAGVDARRENRFKLVGTHDRVVRAVLAGDADVGFVRSGILEQLEAEDPTLADRIHVVNRQDLRGFPFVVSTRLYPEWPMAALPHVDDEIVRRFASALFSIEDTYPAALAAGIAGFSPPADYHSVEALARSLRVAPYDQVPRVAWTEVFEQYRIWIITVSVLLLMLVMTALWLGRKKRQLGKEQKRLRRLILSWPQPMLTLSDSVFMDSNRAAVDLLQFSSPLSLIGKDIAAFSPRLQPDGSLSSAKLATLLDHVRDGAVEQLEWLFRRSDGSQVWVDMTLAPIHEPGEGEPFILCSWYDITDRKESEQRQRLAASVFEHAREAIFITDSRGMVIDVNDAYTEITGWVRSRAIGRLPPLPLDEGTAVFSSCLQQGFWRGEFASKRQGGQRYMAALTISPVRDDNGSVTHFVGLFSDISKLKAQEEKLRTMAHYDVLTQLPNRVLFAERLQQAMAQARRQDYRLAVVYIDLDEFKPVNDAFGHQAGDELLVDVATRMRAELREEDTLARLGGDEFAALVVNVGDTAALEALLDRLLQAIAKPTWVASHSVRVSASMGYTYYPQPEELDGDQLLRQADQAMYRAKQTGRNRYCAFRVGESGPE
ncbi:diguanylate cyclase domain-containing protein [Marinobacter koreensis]|uniref:Diguanylate cyclase domain-containing protein n=1 Tax=Marinobacter koreensis TaxID=335974 RepID=A0ABW0RL88_9GAMM|nr:diguanylate cyclase [Marinobacter koreensis]MCK7547693.1 diguanylate cyclase [Marinobacter koreensis]